MNESSLSAALRDVVAIPVTPFRGGEIDIDAYTPLLRRLVDAGVGVITPNGNTSEFYGLTPSERRRLIEAAAAAVGTRAQLLAGVGHDVGSAIADAQYASGLGIRMVMVHQPNHPHVSVEGWLEYHREIASAIPDIGVVLYVRNDWLDGATLARLGELCPNVIAVKYAVPDASVFGRVRSDAGAERFVWIAGLAEPYALSYAAHGAEGFTSGLVNVNPQLSIRLRDRLRERDYSAASRLLDTIARFEEMRAEDRAANNVSVVKEALHQLGWCRRDVRPPSSVLPPAARAEVAQIVKRWAAVDDLGARSTAVDDTDLVAS